MSEFVIRAAVPDDAPQMAEVIAAGREQTYGLSPHSYAYSAMVTGWRGEAGARTMRNYMNATGEWGGLDSYPRSLVATRLGGTAVVGLMTTRELHDRHAVTVKLDFIFVDPAEQGKGVGHILMDDLTEYADNRRQELDVVHHNRRAQRLYENYGFALVPGAFSGRHVQFQKMVKPAKHA